MILLMDKSCITHYKEYTHNSHSLGSLGSRRILSINSSGNCCREPWAHHRKNKDKKARAERQRDTKKQAQPL